MGGMWRSTDAGATWSKGNAGLPTSGGVVEYFKQIPANPPFFYLKIGNTLYKSTDHVLTWRIQGTIPGTSPNFDVNELLWSRMYWIDQATLKVWTSFDEGRVWQTFGSLPAALQGSAVLGTGSLFTNASTLFSSIENQASFVSTDNG